jgi:hypothetical protein
MILLNMIVCSLCAMEAKKLQLHTEEIMLEANRFPFEFEGVTVRDSEFNRAVRPGHHLK